MGVIKKDGALQNEVKKGGALQNKGIIVINWGGTKKKCKDKKTGATKKKVMSPGVPGGVGAEHFDRRISANRTKIIQFSIFEVNFLIEMKYLH